MAPIEMINLVKVKAFQDFPDFVEKRSAMPPQDVNNTAYIQKPNLDSNDKDIIIIKDIRFENEAAYIRSIGGSIWHIVRANAQAVNMHSSEFGITVNDQDTVIHNNGTLEELGMRIIETWKSLISAPVDRGDMDHLYKPKEAVHDVVVSADNHEIECLYQGHSFYDKAIAICLALHLTFIKYCPTRGRITNIVVRRAIWMFFDFIEAYNSRNPIQLWILKITDLSAEVYKQFENYLLKNNEPVTYAARLKTALKSASSMTDAIPDLLLPFAKRASTQSRLPFSDETENVLANAFTSSIDRLYEILEFRKLVTQAKPYTLTEIISKVTYSKETIFQWLQYKFDSDLKLDWRELHSKLTGASDPELREIASLSNWRALIYSAYQNRSEEFQFDNPENPFQFRKILNFNPDPARVIRTLIENGYPFEIDLDEIIEKYSATKVNALEKCNDVIQLIMHRWSKPVTPLGFHSPLKWDDLLNLYYPSMQDMSCIVQFIMLQTNWNKEAVLAIDPNNFEHALTGAMNEKHVMLQTEKTAAKGSANLTMLRKK